MRRPAALLIIAGVLLALLIAPSGAFSAHAQESLSIAGSVSVPANASQYVDVQVIDGSSGAVFRYQQLDATHSFAFAGIPLTATEVRLFLRLPERRFRLDSAASSLSVRIPKAASGADPAWLHLTAAVEEVSSAAPEGLPQGGSVLTAVTTVVGLAVVALGRHRLLSLLQLPNLKVPKPRKLIMTSSR
ncbi:uncharacterized protein Tco025E_04603 [Trypanosoma conorhini]|uniref:Uncharacterized protein n=1 Tax=Trypanosoma conorhini TaxID=83891 RepID=A0A422PKB5_9TRYP|nr:uncharacterized protein Tco025E_04603 [Trypanosoma conorhini]RNF18145.1 hypothetical protein Tco025E_04603 [Trypanosoma conorhini]